MVSKTVVATETSKIDSKFEKHIFRVICRLRRYKCSNFEKKKSVVRNDLRRPTVKYGNYLRVYKKPVTIPPENSVDVRQAESLCTRLCT